MRNRPRVQKYLYSSFLTALLCCLLCLSPARADAEVVSSTELMERCRFYDGKMVTYRGEVIGDVMIRGEHTWINLNDDPYGTRRGRGSKGLAGYNRGQSIWCKANDVKDITYTGDYRHSGDIVEVTGIFNRACPEHGGDMDIHAIKVDLIKSGHRVSHPFNIRRALIALVLLMISGGLFTINRLKVRKHEGRG